MKLPNISGGKKLGTNDYMTEVDPAAEKKKKIFTIAGVILLLLLLSIVLFGNKATPGQEELRRSVQATADALGVVDEYEKYLQYAPTKNDVALTQTLLRGNYQQLNDLYKTFKPKKNFTTNPKPNESSIETLDEAVRNNTIDNQIIEVLKPIIEDAKRSLQTAKPLFTKDESAETLQTAIDDMQSIAELLNRDR